MTIQEIKEDYALTDEEIRLVLSYAAQLALEKELAHVQLSQA